MIKKIIFISILFVSLFLHCTAQEKRVSMDSLTSGQGSYLYHGIPFTGVAFYIEPSTGILRKEKHIKNGKNFGAFVEYNEEGNLKEKGSYGDKGPIGIWTKYLKNGSKYTERIYNPTGFTEKKFFENGKVEQESIFKDGKETGIVFNELGQKVKEFVFFDGKYISEKYFDTTSGIAMSGIAGYWETTGNSFANAIHIIKDQNLYKVEHFKNKTTPIIIRENITIESGILNTGQGSYQYVEGNDIILDKSLEPSVKFIRIPKASWEIMTGNR